MRGECGGIQPSVDLDGAAASRRGGACAAPSSSARASDVDGETARRMEEAADGWLIAHLRGRPRRHRLEEHLLDRRLRGLDIQGLAEHLNKLEAEVAEMRERLHGEEPEEPPAGHVLFFPIPDGYEVVEADEPPPPISRLLLVDDRWFRVVRVGRSPFPRDRRPCLFLELAPDVT
jgi:hypothetical protein